MTTLANVEQSERNQRAPTMREVATLAGVSLKTVSRVINGAAGVSPELAERVLHAVQLLDYNPNTTASSLRRSDQRTATIGLLLEDVANPFSSALHRAIEDVARQHNTLVLAGSSDENPRRAEEVMHALASRRVDGLIVVPASADQNSFRRVQRLGRPIVFVDRPAPLHAADSIVADNQAGARRAVAHLAAHGHRRIAFLGDLLSIWTAAERHRGYIEGLAAEGLRLDDRLIRTDIHSSDAAEQAARILLAGANPPSALFTGQNLITIGAIRALQALNLQHSIGLVGFDDLRMADLLNPAVSVIAQEPALIGRAAAELVFARINGDERPPQHLIVPTRLVPRGSGEIRAD